LIKEQGFSQVTGSLSLQKVPASQKECLQKQNQLAAYQQEKWLAIRSQEVVELTHKLTQIKELVATNDWERLKSLLKKGKI
jgi:hypothetical protein